MIEKILIKHLADGQFHSGQKLADDMGISRTAVWKQLKKLSLSGLSTEMVKGQGYRIPGGIELLQQDRVLDAVPQAVKRMIYSLMICDEIDSTNKKISTLPEKERHGAVCIAEMQTAGRGRRGRSWVSPFGKNIYLSLGWRFEGGASSLEGLSLAVGVAVCRALTAENTEWKAQSGDLQLKWPNDILFKGRKLGGVLVEVQGDLSGVCHITIGVGLNHGMSGVVVDEIDQPWADVTELSSVTRNRLAGLLIAELIETIRVFELAGFTAFKEEWSSYDGYKNVPVTLQTVSASTKGICRGIAESGALLVETDKGIEVFSGGEISMRKQP